MAKSDGSNNLSMTALRYALLMSPISHYKWTQAGLKTLSRVKRAGALLPMNMKACGCLSECYVYFRDDDFCTAAVQVVSQLATAVSQPLTAVLLPFYQQSK